MREIKHFTDLEAWRVNHKVTLAVYKLTKEFPKEEKYALTDQLRRSVSSICANIAEGWGRYHYADKNKFYYNARGSSTETQNFLILAKDLGYLTTKEYRQTNELVFEGFKLINGLIRSINRVKSKK